MNATEAELVVMRWDHEAMRRGRQDKRKHLWRILDCLAGWRRYDDAVAAAFAELAQTPQVEEVRAVCMAMPKPTNGFKD